MLNVFTRISIRTTLLSWNPCRT